MRWPRFIATPVRETRALFPFSSEGRQTLVYLVFAGAGPALTILVMRILDQTRDAGQWPIYAVMAEKVAWALLITVAALGTYVAWRAIKLNKDGFSAESKDAAPIAQFVADKAQDAADQIKGEV